MMGRGRIPIENEYLSNPSDIIDEEEEEYEESVQGESPKKEIILPLKL
jgi:hypothetical protein